MYIRKPQRRHFEATKAYLLATALLLLAACGPSLQEQVACSGQSVILVGIEINSDFTPNLLSGTPSDIYNLSLGLRGGRGLAGGGSPRVVIENIDTRSRWLAFPVHSGVY